MAAVFLITHPDVAIDPSVPVPDWPLNARGSGLDYTLASRDPSARLLSAGRVGPGFPPGQRIYRIVPLNHLVSF
jgi:hypothetical protein